MGNWGHQGGFLFILLAQATARTQKKKTRFSSEGGTLRLCKISMSTQARSH